jgi:hypothetical protein
MTSPLLRWNSTNIAPQQSRRRIAIITLSRARVAHYITAWFSMTLLQDCGLHVELRPGRHQLRQHDNDAERTPCDVEGSPVVGDLTKVRVEGGRVQFGRKVVMEQWRCHGLHCILAIDASNSAKRFELLLQLIYLLMGHMYFFSDVQRW